jgi:hypothetical protein
MIELIHSNGIHLPHLSPSTINSFITDRFGFYKSKVLGAPFKGNGYTARGTAVEAGVNTLITGEGDPLEVCNNTFKEELSKAGVSMLEVEYIYDSLPGLIDVAVDHFSAVFKNNDAKSQTFIEARLEGVERKVIGYLDFDMVNLIVDCKVTSKSPSKLSQNYAIQGSVYRKATGKQVEFHFVVPNKKPVIKTIRLSDDEYSFYIAYATLAAQRIEAIERCECPKTMMNLILSFPDLSAMWNDKDRNEAKKFLGL